MPPPDNGNEYTPFTTLIALDKLDNATFRSTALPFSPGGGLPGSYNRAYGGHVYAQAAWAACQTVAPGMLLHNVTGTFLLPGACQIRFVYTVQRLRDGKSYAARLVSVTQPSSSQPPSADKDSDICFTALCSFKRPESPGPLDVQTDIDLWTTYAASLRGKTPAAFPECPGMDVPWYWAHRARTGANDAFPGLEARKADMDAYNAPRHPFDRRGIIFYRALGAMPRDANLHLVAHLYASDRNSLYVVANLLDVGDLWTSLSSLVHTTVFHAGMEDLWFEPSTPAAVSPMHDASERGRWFAKEDRTDRAGAGRAMFHSRVSNARGAHVASVVQEGLIRFGRGDGEAEAVRARREGWQGRAKL